MAGSPTIIESLDVLADRYEALLCDVWGVLHNGVEAFPEACRALARARARGVAVVLITNSPRPREGVEAQLAALGVPADCWDRVVSSGDVTRDLIREAPRKLFHVGCERDLPVYDGIDCELVEEFEADAVVCTGLMDDETETPEDYVDMLRRFRSRDLPFICANPDIVVERGDKLIWCAGALARDYGQIGGRTLISGKPHRPIYDAALKIVGELLERPADRSKALAIGDGMLTDMKGAIDNDIDALYVSGGIHARDYGDADNPDPARLAAFIEKHGQQPVAVIPQLR